MTKRRDTYHHGQLRAALLKAGLKLLESDGIDAVTIRAVAREAGVAHSAPANHFKDRRTLLTGIATEIFKSRANTAVEILAPSDQGSARERLLLFARDWLDFGLAHPHQYRLIWRRDCLDPHDLALNEQMDRIYVPLVSLYAGIMPGKATSAESQAIGLWSLLHGYLSMRLDGNLTEGRDEVTGQARADAILDSWIGLQDK